MPIPFTCPHCGRQTQVEDRYAGQTGPCAGCGKPITVPGTASAYSNAPPARKFGGAGVALAIVGSLFAILTCGGILAGLLLPAVQSARQRAIRTQCTNNLKQIGLAMHMYHDVYKHFPPAYLADADGKPMHSWRVLLLPYLGQQTLYNQYDFDEPWDGPNNSRLAARMPQVYHCPDHVDALGRETCYAMIVGPDTVSDGPTARRFADIRDGTSNTLLVVETSGSGINWMEPRDLDAEKISFQPNDPSEAEGIRSDHPGGVNVVLCDGAVRFVSDTISPDVLKDLSTIAGGEHVGAF